MKKSLRTNTIIAIILGAAVLSGAIIFASSRIVTRMVDNEFKGRANDLSETLAVSIDTDNARAVRDAVMEIYNNCDNKVSSDDWGSDAFNEYTAQYEEITKMPEYKALKKELTAIQDVNDVDCVYTVYVDIPTEAFIYLVDAAHEDACPVGCIDPIYEMNRKVLKNPSVGFPSYVTNTEEYGWLVTAGVPAYDDDGELVCYTFTDISMNEVRANQTKNLVFMIVIELILTVLIAFLVIRIVTKRIVKPLNMLTEAAANYYKEESNYHSSFSSLDIRTGDEIEELSESMKQMERDINDNTAHILELSEELFESRTEAIHLNELAKKDALTGVRNKYSYDEEIKVLDFAIKGGDTQIGLAIFDLDDLKGINDTYGHATGDIAIRSLAQLICRVFDHSPVFRIGGDEFVAVLRGHDYEHAEELVDEFKDLIGTIREDKSLGPGERISASVGYALYNKRDGGVSGLFKRADSDMYERKRAYKMSRD